MRVDSANESLIRSHQTRERLAITRAWRFAGGASAWAHEVAAWSERERFAVQDPDDWKWFANPYRG